VHQTGSPLHESEPRSSSVWKRLVTPVLGYTDKVQHTTIQLRKPDQQQKQVENCSKRWILYECKLLFTVGRWGYWCSPDRVSLKVIEWPISFWEMYSQVCVGSMECVLLHEARLHGSSRKHPSSTALLVMSISLTEMCFNVNFSRDTWHDTRDDDNRPV